MGAHGQEDWFDEVMPGLDDGRPGGKRRFPWPGRHGKDDGDEAEARTRPRIGVRVGVATVIVTGLMVGAGLFCFNVCSTGSAVFFRSVG